MLLTDVLISELVLGAEFQTTLSVAGMGYRGWTFLGQPMVNRLMLRLRDKNGDTIDGVMLHPEGVEVQIGSVVSVCGRVCAAPDQDALYLEVEAIATVDPA